MTARSPQPRRARNARDAQAFTASSELNQHRYEALRACHVEGLSYAEAGGPLQLYPLGDGGPGAPAPSRQASFVPLAYAWRVEVAHGHLLRSRRLARSFECTLESASGWLQVACLAAVLDALAPRHPCRVAEPKAP